MRELCKYEYESYSSTFFCVPEVDEYLATIDIDMAWEVFPVAEWFEVYLFEYKDVVSPDSQVHVIYHGVVTQMTESETCEVSGEYSNELSLVCTGLQYIESSAGRIAVRHSVLSDKV